MNPEERERNDFRIQKAAEVDKSIFWALWLGAIKGKRNSKHQRDKKVHPLYFNLAQSQKWPY